MPCFEASIGEKRGRPFLPTSFLLLSDGKERDFFKSFPDTGEGTDEGINIRQPNVVHPWVGCQKEAEALPSAGIEHQVWLLILTVVLDAW